MKTSIAHNSRNRGAEFVLIAGLLSLLNAVPTGLAAPPLNPLPAPAFSFDLDSPSVSATTFRAADILVLSNGEPTIAVPGAALGLMSPFDNLDGLSANILVPPSQTFLLLFSVDRPTVGQVGPEPSMVSLGVPFNPRDQALRGQAAGDEFMATQLFTLSGPAPLRGPRLANAVLIRNNYDEGGTDFGAVPTTDAYGNAAKSLDDNVDAIGQLSISGESGAIVNVYFSATASSPSLYPLSGAIPPSGATIFFNPDPNSLAPTTIYAAWYELGLAQADDIDALLVFDSNNSRHFDANDRVLFSLTPNSPGLTTILGASTQGAGADVFVAIPGQLPMIFASAAEFGLGIPTDNIDALDLAPCADWVGCSTQFGIRALKGDLNCDNTVGFKDINPFVLALSSPSAYQTAYPGCFIQNGDINHDGFVNFKDINPFVALLSSGH